MIRPILLFLATAGLLVNWRYDSPEWPAYQAMIAVLFAVAVTAWVLNRVELKWTWAFLPMIAITVWPALQLLLGTTVYRHATILDLLRWITYSMAFALAFWYFRSRSQTSLMLRVLIIYSLVLAAVSTMQHFAGNGKVFWLFAPPQTQTADMGPFLNRDHYASFMALIIPMALLRAFDEPKRRFTYLLAAAAMYSSVIASLSRAGSLLATAEVLLCLFLITIQSGDEESFWRRHRTSLASVFLLGALVAVVGWEALWGRFVDDKDPYRGRREVALSSIAMIRERPLTGFGTGTWTQVYPAYANFDPGVFVNAAHNEWLQWGADGGLLYGALFVVLFGTSLALCWRIPWAIGIPAVFLHSIVDFPLEGRYLPVVLFLIYGAALARAAEKKAKARTR